MIQHASGASAGARRHRWRFGLLLVACSLVAGMVGYASGLSEHGERFSALSAQNSALLAQLSDLQGRHGELRLELIQLESEQAVDAQALNEARMMIGALEAQVAELESELGFYRSIMAPSKSEKGLQLDEFTLTPVANGSAYDLALTVMQVGNNDRFRSGRVAVTVNGTIAGKPIDLALHALSECSDGEGVKYRFRYFQNIECRLTLPDGFVPEMITVALKARSRSEPLLEEARMWSQLLVGDSPNS